MVYKKEINRCKNNLLIKDLIIFFGVLLFFFIIMSISADADVVFTEDFETWGVDSSGDEAPVGWEIYWKYRKTMK